MSQGGRREGERREKGGREEGREEEEVGKGTGGRMRRRVGEKRRDRTAKCAHIHMYNHISSHLHITVYTQGVERFANYKGYGASLEFAGECRDPAEVRCYVTYSVQLPRGLFTLSRGVDNQSPHSLFPGFMIVALVPRLCPAFHHLFVRAGENLGTMLVRMYMVSTPAIWIG